MRHKLQEKISYAKPKSKRERESKKQTKNYDIESTTWALEIWFQNSDLNLSSTYDLHSENQQKCKLHYRGNNQK